MYILLPSIGLLIHAFCCLLVCIYTVLFWSLSHAIFLFFNTSTPTVCISFNPKCCLYIFPFCAVAVTIDVKPSSKFENFAFNQYSDRCIFDFFRRTATLVFRPWQARGSFFFFEIVIVEIQFQIPPWRWNICALTWWSTLPMVARARWPTATSRKSSNLFEIRKQYRYTIARHGNNVLHSNAQPRRK